MLKVVTGRFHPSLESAFVEQIQRIKSGDPWAKLAIIVPSKPILDRLRRLLAVEHRLSLLNVYLLTFHQLALRLEDERRGDHLNAPLRIVDDLFFESLLRHLVEQRSDSSPALRSLGRSFGTWSALWSTIRDLKDGGVDPATALQALGEGCFSGEDEAWLQALFALQAAAQQAGAGLNVGTADDLAEAVVSLVPASPFLASMSHVCYYGFYDLTQVQLTLFQAVTAAAPTTLYFPLGDDPSFAFARRFFDRHIQPLLGSHAVTDLSASETDVQPAEVFVHSVIGAEEELSVTCRAMLDLVETCGYRFDEIGVVARTLDPYRGSVQAIFDRHCIPLTTTVRRPLIHQPLSKTLLSLATLPLNDFYCGGVLDVVTSPFCACALTPDGERSPAYRPEQWKAAVAALNITHGIAEWKRLEQCCKSALELDSGDETGALRPLKIAPEVIELLWATVSQLFSSCAALPTRGTYGTMLEALQRVITQHFHRPDGDHEQGCAGQLSAIGAQWAIIDQALASLSDLDLLGPDLTWAEFVELLTHALERAGVPLQPVCEQGVLFTDAMAARGLHFKALFVLGLNEKVFPRYIREDALLRDRHRRVLDATLGYKIDEKLAGYDEEALLFILLGQSATRRLYLSFQRADDAGRLLAPSSYLTDARQRVKGTSPPVNVVPRRLTERVAQRPTMCRFLPPADLAQWLAFNGREPGDLLQATGREAAMFREGIEVLARTESEHLTLTAFDGATGPLAGHWTSVMGRGIAATPLERYARCPFRYFSADVLRLDPVRTRASHELDPRVLGTFCHGALRRCYELLLPTGWPEKPVTDDTIDWCIESAVEEAAERVERQHRTGHYLLWELAKASIADVMTAAVDEDTRAYHGAPFIPVAFEVLAEGAIAGVTDNGQTPLKIRGRVDRVDRHRQSGALRIIDYKVKVGRAISSEDRNLVQSAVRGYRLQPPLYALLQIPDHGTPRRVELFFLAPRRTNPIARSTFDADVWSAETGVQLRNTLTRLISGIRNGRFFIMPDTYCETCEFRVACRKEHPTTQWRVSCTPESKELAALRSQQVSQ